MDLHENSVPDTCLPGSDTCVSSPDTCVSSSDTCISSSDTCVSSSDTCVSNPDTCVSSSDTCVSGSETCVSSSETCISSSDTCISSSETCVSGREFLLNHPPGDKQGVVDSDPPCPWRANEERESLSMVPAWAADSEIGAPWEEAPLTQSPARGQARSGGLRSAMPMASP